MITRFLVMCVARIPVIIFKPVASLTGMGDDGEAYNFATDYVSLSGEYGDDDGMGCWEVEGEGEGGG